MSFPILFKGPMVRAILDGTKTETRRVVKGQALEWLSAQNFTPEFTADPENHFSRYGYKGDMLYVKETFFPAHEHRSNPQFAICPNFIYRADYEHRVEPRSIIGGNRWKPSIFCSRSAARITLEVTSVHIERLQAIDDEGAEAEGIERVEHAGDTYFKNYLFKGVFAPGDCIKAYGQPIESYSSLWESINGGCSWALNPWVWVIKFKLAHVRK